LLLSPNGYYFFWDSYFLKTLLLIGLVQSIKILGQGYQFPGRDTKIFMMHTTIIQFVAEIIRKGIIRENNYTLNPVFVTHLSTNAFFTILHSLSNTPGYSYNREKKAIMEGWKVMLQN
jgi:hypothetical protein